jgi:hypothetical protein
MHQLGSESLVAGLSAFALVSGLVALPVGIFFTLVSIRWFRSRVGRSMGAAGGAVVPPELHQPFPNGPQGTFYALDVNGPVRFVQGDLALLPWSVACEKYFAWL